MSIHVTDLTEADIPGAVAAIQEAFADDPYSNWVFDKSKFSAERNATSLGLRCRWGMRNALFQVAKEEGRDEVLGVAMWLRPRPAGAPQTWREWLEDWRLWLGQLRMNLWYGRGGLIVKRYYIWKTAQARVQSKVWTDPRGYYFLNIMVVLPRHQGRGVGRRMMEAVTRGRADPEGLPCYLESSRDEPNVAIYRRLGFAPAAALECRDDDTGDAITLSAMVREPASASAGIESGGGPDPVQAAPSND